MLTKRMKDAALAANEASGSAADAEAHTDELVNQLEQHIAAVAEMRAALEGLLKLHQAHHRETTPEEIAAECALETANNLEPAQ